MPPPFLVASSVASGRLGCMIPGLSLALLNKKRVFLGAIYCFLWLYVRFSVVPGGGWFHISASKRAWAGGAGRMGSPWLVAWARSSDIPGMAGQSGRLVSGIERGASGNMKIVCIPL